MARIGKPSGNKRTSFGKRTEAEKSFRERKRSKPDSRGDSFESKKSVGPRKFSAPHFSKDKPGEGRFSFGPGSARPSRNKKSYPSKRDGDNSSQDKSRFSRSGSFSRLRFGSDKPQGGGKSSFDRKSGSGPFRGNKDPKSFSRDDKGQSYGERKFSKREAGDFSSSKFSRLPSSDGPKKSAKPFDRKGEDRFSKFKKEEKPFRRRNNRDSKFEKTTTPPFEQPRDAGRTGKPDREKSDFKKSFSKKEKSFGQQIDRAGKTVIPAEVTEQKLSDGLVRLNKFMANSGVGSRREADELIKMGLVTVNGETITEMGHKVKLTDDVRYEGRKLKAEPLVYVLLNKPKGFITTTEDPNERKTVMDLVAAACKERIYPVGRLDRNTTGLLLLTNDGDLADKLTHPSYNAKKIYKVELDRPLTKNDFQKILDGVYFDEGRALVDDLAIVSDDGKEIGIELHIGWNRIVRRIFEALGYEIIRLDRVAYAGLDKKDLGRGQWRFLKPEEVVRLKHFQG